MEKDLEVEVVFDFLRNGLSARAICKKHPEIADKTGFKSHSILKKYGLEPKYKGLLFLLSKISAKKIILDNVINNDKKQNLYTHTIPDWLSNKYNNSKLISKNVDIAYNCLDGELRNNILRLFNPRKKDIGICQYSDCKNNILESAHKRNSERKKIFIKSANKYKTKISNNSYSFPILEIMVDFLLLHKDGKIFFLCKKHHSQYDSTPNYREFESRINN